MKLYELPSAFAGLDLEIDANGGELSDELLEQLNTLEMTLEEKGEAIAGLIRTAEAEAEAYDRERARFDERAKACANRAVRLKSYLMGCLEAMGRDRLKAGLFSIRIQANSAPSIRWESNEPIPEGFRRVRVELDGDAARRAEREGMLPDGFQVYRGKHLRIS